MGVLDTGGTAVGSSGASSGLVRICASSGTSTSVANAAVEVIRLVTSAASATGTSSTSAAIVRLHIETGSASGTAQVVPLVTAKYGVLSGWAAGSSEVEAYISDRDIYRLLVAKLPSIFTSDPIIQGLMQIFAVEMIKLSATIAWVQDQMVVDSTSVDELSRFEEELDVKLGLIWTADQRRKAIKERLKKPGILTKKGLKNQLRQYYVCTVDEHPLEQRVESTILSKRGIPLDIAAMEATVDRTLPAHLEHEFIYTWLPWSEIEAVNLTCEQAEAFSSCDELETAFLIPFVDPEPDEGS